MRFLIFKLLLLIPFSNSFGQVPKKAETVPLNDTQIYYEVYGNGEPLFLLHGFTMSSKYWLNDVPEFTNDFEVYLVDLTGHGRSAAFKEKFSMRSIAEDVAALIEYLKLDKIKAIGYSYGGDVLFHLASMKPKMIQSMITIGAIGIRDLRNFPDKLEYFAYESVDNIPWIRVYQTDEEHIRPMLDHFQNYTISLNDNELRNIQSRTLIIVGDNDKELPMETLSRVRALVNDSDLWIVPNSGHNAHEGKNRNDFLRISKEFLKE